MTDPVLIIGAGPTGLTAALELSRMGVPVRLIERAAAPATTSRAIGVQARTLELLAQRGLAETLIARGIKAEAGDIYGDGKALLRLDFKGLASRYPFLLLVAQSETEAVLRDALSRQGVAVEWGCELVGFGQIERDGQLLGVEAVLRDAQGRLSVQSCPWMISAEGAHARVRATLGLEFIGDTLPEHFALGDVSITGALPRREFQIFTSQDGLLAAFPLGQDRFRLIASLARGADTGAPGLTLFQTLYDQRAHIPAQLRDLHWSSTFRIQSRLVEKLRVGRVLLGGDSAHIHSPAGAQGMNTGIQDMINLGWKLARVIKGQSRQSLLDSYSADRRPVLEDVLNQTEALTEAMETESHLLRGAINRLAPILGRSDRVKSTAIARMSEIAIAYRDSPLSIDHTHAGTVYAGDRMPDLDVRVLRNGRWRGAQLSAQLSPSDFTIVIAHPVAADPPGERLTAPVPFTRIVQIAPPEDRARPEHQPSFDTLFGRHARCLLIRPDGYIAMTCPVKSAPKALQEYARGPLG